MRPPFTRRPQVLALIVTTQSEAVTEHVLTQMRRGATCLRAEGGFTGQERSVLMVALTVTEIAQLKDVVRQQDRAALVVVVPAQSVFGRGFQPLGAP
jgi:uncharacterized membrane-anchored protein YitT (DUF2179 family)